MADDYYSILGVPRNASQADIQKAYRDLARKYHPDLHPDDKDATKKFQQVQAAFDVLNAPEKREMYDRYGSSFETRGAGGPGGPGGAAWSQGPEGGFQFDFDDGFAQFFGDRFGAGGEPSGGGFGDFFRQFRGANKRGSKASGNPRRGADLSAEVEIPFTIAVVGGQVDLTLNRPGGRSETLAVKIPPGIEEGKRIRLRGQGDAGGASGTRGDLLVTVHIQPHPHFQRQGAHLHLRLPITLAEAVEGAKVDIPTPSGHVSLRIPPGTSSGTKLRVKGHGVALRDHPPGDLLVEAQIVLPKDISEADRKGIAEIANRYPYDPRSSLAW